MSAGGPALVVAAHGRRGVLETADGRRLPYLLPSRRLTAYCGDHVEWTEAPGEPGSTLVTAILPRRCELRRQPPRQAQPETLAVNLSHLLIVVAPVPEPDPFLVDRYLCAAELMGAAAAIAWNKRDLDPSPPPAFAGWQRLGYPVFAISARDGAGTAEIAAWLGRGTGMLVGPSGTGKSSLLNALVPGSAEETGSVSAGTGEGRHTTTASVMLALPGGARLIDSPGVRDFVPAVPGLRDAALGFLEIAAVGSRCRFADCLHLREPGCAVQAAVVAGEVDERRFESYRRLVTLARQAAERRAPGG